VNEAWKGRTAGTRPSLLGHGDGSEAGRRHQRLLRAGDDNVKTPLVRLQGEGAETRDRVDRDERAGLIRGGGERLDVGDDAGRRLGLRQQHDSRSAEVAKPSGQILGRRRLAPLVPELFDAAAVGPRDLAEPLAEVPG
jgi:hypothetical protein